MGVKDQGPRAEGKPEVGPPLGRVRSIGDWVAANGTEPGAMVAYRIALRNAWEHFRLDKLKTAAHLVNRLLRDLERWSSVGTGGLSEAALIRAGALVVRGCVFQRKVKIKRMRKTLIKAIQIYQSAFHGPNPEAAEGQDYRFHGLALYLRTEAGQGVAEPALSRALEALHAAVAHGDTTQETFWYLGRIYQRQKEWEKAEHFTRRSLALAPSRPSANFTLGEILEAQGRKPEAVQAFEKAAGAFAATERFKEALEVLDHIAALVPNDARGQTFRGLVLTALGRYPEALAALERGLAQRVDDAWALMTKGRALRLAGRPDDSTRTLRDALERDPNLADAHVELATTLLALGRTEEALQAADRALDLQTEMFPALVVRGQALRELGLLEEAVQVFRALRRRAPGLLWARVELADALAALDRHEDALKVLNGALQDHPENPVLLGSKGLALQALGANEDAEQVLRHAVSLDPENAWLHALLGEVFRALGRFDEALKALDRAVAIRPDYAYALATRGQVFRAQGHLDRAVPALTEALRIDPELDWARTELAECHLQAGAPRDAVKDLDAVLLSRPDDPYVLTLAGIALRASEEPDRSEESLRQAARLDPENAWTLTQLGETLLVLDRADEALKELDHALTLQPEDENAHAARGQALRVLDRLDEAVDAFRMASDLDPKNVWRHTQLAEILRLRGRLPDALEVLDAALSIDPHDAPALATRGQVLRALGRRDEALAAALHAFEHDPDLGWSRIELATVLTDLDYLDEALDVLETTGSLHSARDRAEQLGLMGQVHCAMGQYEPARKRLDESLAQDSRVDWIHGVRGWALENLGLPDEALAAYQKAAELNPKSWWWRKGIANALHLAGELKTTAAHEEYAKVIELAEASSKSLDAELISLIGWCHYRLGHPETAIRSILQALIINPKLVSDQFDLALVLLVSGNFEPAGREYQKALEMIRMKPASRRVGLVRVALRDLKMAAAAKESGPDVKREAENAAELIAQALVEAEKIVNAAAAIPGRALKTVRIAAPVNVVYSQLSQVERYKDFMENVEEVSWEDKKRLAWKFVLKEPSGQWSADVVEQVPGRRLSCQTRSDSDLKFAYTVTLAPENATSTMLLARLSYSIPNDPGAEPEALRAQMEGRLERDLRNFKKHVESQSALGDPPRLRD